MNAKMDLDMELNTTKETEMSFHQLTDAIILAAGLPTYYAASAGGEIRPAVLRGYLIGVRAAYGHILDAEDL